MTDTVPTANSASFCESLNPAGMPLQDYLEALFVGQPMTDVVKARMADALKRWTLANRFGPELSVSFGWNGAFVAQVPGDYSG